MGALAEKYFLFFSLSLVSQKKKVVQSSLCSWELYSTSSSEIHGLKNIKLILNLEKHASKILCLNGCLNYYGKQKKKTF